MNARILRLNKISWESTSGMSLWNVISFFLFLFYYSNVTTENHKYICLQLFQIIRLINLREQDYHLKEKQGIETWSNSTKIKNSDKYLAPWTIFYTTLKMGIKFRSISIIPLPLSIWFPALTRPDPIFATHVKQRAAALSHGFYGPRPRISRFSRWLNAGMLKSRCSLNELERNSGTVIWK